MKIQNNYKHNSFHSFIFQPDEKRTLNPFDLCSSISGIFARKKNCPGWLAREDGLSFFSSFMDKFAMNGILLGKNIWLFNRKYLRVQVHFVQLHKQMNIDFGYISCSRMYWRTRYKEISIQLLNLTWTWGAWNDLDPFIVFISLIFNLDISGVWLFGYFFRPHLHSFGKAKKICKKSAVFCWVHSYCFT